MGTRHASDSELRREFLRPARCCRLCLVGDCLRALTILACMFDLVLCSLICYQGGLFIFFTSDSDFQEDFLIKLENDN